jgi:hypothetical protein
LNQEIEESRSCLPLPNTEEKYKQGRTSSLLTFARVKRFPRQHSAGLSNICEQAGKVMTRASAVSPGRTVRSCHTQLGHGVREEADGPLAALNIGAHLQACVPPFDRWEGM